MDSRFSFLDVELAELLSAILERRAPILLERLIHANSVSYVDAEAIMSALSDELTDNLDDDWEPKECGLRINALLAQFNATRISEWP